MNSQYILTLAKNLVPKLTTALHKGQAGRLGILGGSEDYSGAPYFSAMTGLRMGADLVYIFSEPKTAQVIKTYSPDLIVLPYLTKEGNCEQITNILPRLHALVVGPGLSTQPGMLDQARIVINKAKEVGLYLILDADVLCLIKEEPNLIKGYKKAVISPNLKEFERFCKSLNVETVEQLSDALGGVTVVLKGASDIICNEKVQWKCNLEGGLKRHGGQGDILSGAIGTFLAWRHLQQQQQQQQQQLPAEKEEESIAACCYAACALTKECSNLTFQQKGRSSITTDMLENIGKAFQNLFPHL